MHSVQILIVHHRSSQRYIPKFNEPVLIDHVTTCQLCSCIFWDRVSVDSANYDAKAVTRLKSAHQKLSHLKSV